MGLSRIRWAALGAILFITWLLWSGHYTAFLMSLGAASCAAVLALVRWMDILDDEGVASMTLLRTLTYIPWLFGQIILANLKVAGRILHPRKSISPTLVLLKTSQRTPLGAVIYTNSITLTPGTVTLRLDNGNALVHALIHEDGQALYEGEMDRRVARLEGPA